MWNKQDIWSRLLLSGLGKTYISPAKENKAKLLLLLVGEATNKFCNGHYREKVPKKTHKLSHLPERGGVRICPNTFFQFLFFKNYFQNVSLSASLIQKKLLVQPWGRQPLRSALPQNIHFLRLPYKESQEMSHPSILVVSSTLIVFNCYKLEILILVH